MNLDVPGGPFDCGVFTATLVNLAVTVTSAAGMVKVVTALEASANVPPLSDVQPLKL